MRVRELVDSIVGNMGSITVASPTEGVELITVEPHVRGAREIWIAFDGWLTVGIGDIGGVWELEYKEADVEFLTSLITSVVEGRVEQVFGFARSMVEVILPDGEIIRETGYDGCLTLLVPQPFWQRLGRHVRYLPYEKLTARATC